MKLEFVFLLLVSTSFINTGLIFADSDDCCEELCCNDEYFCQGYLAARSQGSNMARRLVGTHLYTDTYNVDEFIQVFSATAAYSRTFDNEQIGRYFSPVCNSNCFTIGADGEANVRSEDFGLACTGEACLLPKSSSFIFDIHYYAGLDPLCKGLFFQFYLPIVHNSRKINCCAFEVDDCDSNFEVCLMSTNTANTAVGSTDICKALNGCFVWGDVENEMRFGSLNADRNKTGVADLQLELGYNYWLNDDAYWGLKIIAKAPTGNRAKGRMIFEPIVGNGGHAEAGGGLSAYWKCWESDTNRFVSTRIEADFTHLFATKCQTRVFDLNNGCNQDPSRCFSRYLLLKEFKNEGTELEGLERGPNVFAQPLTVRIPIQVDLTWLWSFRRDCWMIDLGYNFWARSQEEVEDFFPNIPEQTYGIKGTLPMCSGINDTPNTQTASRSTICETKGIDGENDGTVSTFINCADINICSALSPSAQSHSGIINIAYLWSDYDYEPWLSIGAQVEGSGRGNTALDQWSIWAKGGFTF